MVQKLLNRISDIFSAIMNKKKIIMRTTCFQNNSGRVRVHAIFKFVGFYHFGLILNIDNDPPIIITVLFWLCIALCEMTY